MSESAQLQRIVVALGIIAAFVVLMYSGLGISGGPPSIAAITYPTFDNPFSPKTAAFHPSSEGPNNGPPRGTSHGDGSLTTCVTGSTNSGGSTFGCLQTADELSNYVSLQTLFISDRFSENISGPGFSAGGYTVISMTIYAECTSEDATRALEVNFLKSGVPFFSVSAVPNIADQTHRSGSLKCPSPIGTWTNISMTLTSETGILGLDPATLEGAEMQFAYDSQLGPKVAWISEMHISILYQRTFSCNFQDAGNPWDNIVRATYYVGCVLQAAAAFIWDALTFIVNVVIFIGEWVGTFITIIGSVFGIIAWLYAIPGMPFEVQIFIDSALTGAAIVLVYNVVKILRGSQG